MQDDWENGPEVLRKINTMIDRYGDAYWTSREYESLSPENKKWCDSIYDSEFRRFLRNFGSDFTDY